MPTLLIRGLTRDLLTRIKAYARAREVSTPDAAAQLLEAGLDATAARQAGAAAVNAARTPAERSAAARKAVQARWNREENEPS